VKGPKADWKPVGSLDADAEPAPIVLGLGELPRYPWSAAAGTGAPQQSGGRGQRHSWCQARAAAHQVVGGGKPGGGRRRTCGVRGRRRTRLWAAANLVAGDGEHVACAGGGEVVT
jgi:hypothetical protein